MNSAEERMLPITSICQISDYSSEGDTFDYDGEFSLYNELHSLISDFELGAKPLSESYSSFQSLRIRRMAELSVSLRDVVLKLCLRENLLVLDKSRSLRFDRELYNFQSTSDYYVFELRHILI